MYEEDQLLHGGGGGGGSRVPRSRVPSGGAEQTDTAAARSNDRDIGMSLLWRSGMIGDEEDQLHGGGGSRSSGGGAEQSDTRDACNNVQQQQQHGVPGSTTEQETGQESPTKCGIKCFFCDTFDNLTWFMCLVIPCIFFSFPVCIHNNTKYDIGLHFHNNLLPEKEGFLGVEVRGEDMFEHYLVRAGKWKYYHCHSLYGFFGLVRTSILITIFPSGSMQQLELSAYSYEVPTTSRTITICGLVSGVSSDHGDKWEKKLLVLAGPVAPGVSLATPEDHPYGVEAAAGVTEYTRVYKPSNSLNYLLTNEAAEKPKHSLMSWVRTFDTYYREGVVLLISLSVIQSSITNVLGICACFFVMILNQIRPSEASAFEKFGQESGKFFVQDLSKAAYYFVPIIYSSLVVLLIFPRSESPDKASYVIQFITIGIAVGYLLMSFCLISALIAQQSCFFSEKPLVGELYDSHTGLFVLFFLIFIGVIGLGCYNFTEGLITSPWLILGPLIPAWLLLALKPALSQYALSICTLVKFIIIFQRGCELFSSPYLIAFFNNVAKFWSRHGFEIFLFSCLVLGTAAGSIYIAVQTY